VIAVADVRTTSPDPELQALQAEWPDWKIWRARRRDDQPGELATGEFLATSPADEWGADRTLMLPTAEKLDAALRRRQAHG
jgi:hypothetical protein